MSLIERRAGMKFERIGAPQPQDMARIAGERAAVAVKVSFAAAVSSYIQCVALLGTEWVSAPSPCAFASCLAMPVKGRLPGESDSAGRGFISSWDSRNLLCKVCIRQPALDLLQSDPAQMHRVIHANTSPPDDLQEVKEAVVPWTMDAARELLATVPIYYLVT